MSDPALEADASVCCDRVFERLTLFQMIGQRAVYQQAQGGVVDLRLWVQMHGTVALDLEIRAKLRGKIRDNRRLAMGIDRHAPVLGSPRRRGEPDLVSGVR